MIDRPIPLPPELQGLLAQDRFVFQMVVFFGERTRLLTDRDELVRMITAHMTSLLETFTTGPKPFVIVNLVHQDTGPVS